VIKSSAGGERRIIGLFGGAGSLGSSRIEHNDPEGVKPQRGVEIRGELGERSDHAGGNGSQALILTTPESTGKWAE
jgi:hypothetical protein